MNIKISKEKLQRFASFAVLSAYMLTDLKVVVSCRGTNHREELCFYSKACVALGDGNRAIRHQKEEIYKTKNLDDYEYPRLGTLEHEYVNSVPLNNNVEKFSEVSIALHPSSCFNVSEDDSYVEVYSSIYRERVGVGLMTGNDYVQLRKSKNSDTVITGETQNQYFYTNSPLNEVITSINYIGPVGNNYPKAVVLEDRDGNKKEVASFGSYLSDTQLTKLFKTYYFDEKAGYYKIDEDLLVDFMRTAFVSRDYANKIVTQVEKDGRVEETVSIPEGYVGGPNGVCYRDTNPYADFSLYSFRTQSDIETNEEVNNNVRKLIK